jgi:hypothetical protein
MLGLKDRNSIGIGPAEIRIGSYPDTVAQILPTLTTANYFGYSEVTNIVYNVDYITRRAVNSVFMNEMISDVSSCAIEMQTVELSGDILNLLFGIFPSTNNYISLGRLPDIDIRLEILYTYPDSTKKLYFVFPKVRIKKGLNLSLTSDAEVVQSLNMVVLEETSSLWSGNELGIIYKEGF